MIKKETCEKLRRLLEPELERIGNEMNLKITAGNTSYSDNQIKLSVRADAYGEDGCLPEEVQFRKLASIYDLSPDDFGKKIMLSGKCYTICGINPNARKNPIKIRCGESNYVVPAELVKSLLNKT